MTLIVVVLVLALVAINIFTKIENVTKKQQYTSCVFAIMIASIALITYQLIGGEFALLVFLLMILATYFVLKWFVKEEEFEENEKMISSSEIVNTEDDNQVESKEKIELQDIKM
ncbi:hypothetical protein [Alkalihalobacillus sp. LMS39]|uniref:hypothetical protein n=1 Tax=Alkalihalobacillus sp. LMS39 TaxID=2924032 RepID=UPI001FB40708|nr:hypothetical protein [Alkalihalobacillus sp. LMS39]UOE93315.1 hypothetical protein MM271_19275 [Alkalihalobacillus sp. LMS39]